MRPSAAAVAQHEETMASTEDSGVLDSVSLAAAGVSESAIALLNAQQVDHLSQMEEFGPGEWQHLYSSGLTLGDRRALNVMLEKFRERPLKLPPPPSIPFNLGSIVLGALFAAPTIALGLINEFGPYDSTRALTLSESLLTVLLPGGVYLVANVVIIETYRTTFSTDVLEQRSVGVSIRDAERSMLTNMAVVAALLLTVIIAMMQSELPGEEPRALLAQWYQIFLYAAMVPCFAAVVLSSMLLLYIEPLDEAASISFVGTFVDFFGEPSFAVIFGIANFVPAMTLWMFGTYGISVGGISALSTVLLIRKVTLTFFYMSSWDNTELNANTLASRKMEAKDLRKAGKGFFSLFT